MKLHFKLYKLTNQEPIFAADSASGWLCLIPKHEKGCFKIWFDFMYNPPGERMEISDVTSALKAYNAIDDRRDKLRLEYEAKSKKLKKAQEEVAEYLRSEMKRLGLKAIEAPGEGVATIKIKRNFGCPDWGGFWGWVVDNKCPEFLQKRLLDSAIQTYLDTNGDLPPFISSRAEEIIAVTKRPPK